MIRLSVKHYRGDILTIYAMLGFVLLITYRLPDKYLLLLSLLLIFDLPGIITRVVGLAGNDPTVNEFIRQDQTKILQYYNTFKSGTYFDLLKSNVESFSLKNAVSGLVRKNLHDPWIIFAWSICRQKTIF